MPARVMTSVSGTISCHLIDAQHNPQTFCMEVVEFSGVTAVHSPWLTAGQLAPQPGIHLAWSLGWFLVGPTLSSWGFQMQSWLWKVCYWHPRQCWLLWRGCFPGRWNNRYGVAFSGSSFTKMCGSWYIFRGAGWCMTSVFLLLMVKPEFVASSRKVIHAQLHFHLIWLLLLRAQSSVKRSSLSVATFTFVFALGRLRLNTPPYVLYFSWMPSSLSCEALGSMAANTLLKRVWARTQLCFTPFVTGNESEESPLSMFYTTVCTLLNKLISYHMSRTVALIPSCNWRTSAVHFLGQPNLSIICHSPSLQTVSNALVNSMNVMKRSSYCSWHFSCSWRAAKIMSTVTRPPRDWLSGTE